MLCVSKPQMLCYLRSSGSGPCRYGAVQEMLFHRLPPILRRNRDNASVFAITEGYVLLGGEDSPPVCLCYLDVRNLFCCWTSLQLPPCRGHQLCGMVLWHQRRFQVSKLRSLCGSFAPLAVHQHLPSPLLACRRGVRCPGAACGHGSRSRHPGPHYS